MAEKRETYIVDDLDGTVSKGTNEAFATLQFGLDGKSYEIDLRATNAGKLREVLAPFIGKARKQSGGSSGRRGHLSVVQPTSKLVRMDREQNEAIREWARKRGMKVSDRGRIPALVLEAFHRNGSQKAAEAPEAAVQTPEPVGADNAAAERLAAAPDPAPKPATPRKPRAARGNRTVEPPKAAPTGKVTRLNKITGSMIGAVAEFVGEMVIDHGETWVELRGNRDDIAAKITAVQSDMPGGDMKQRARKASLTRVVNELRNLKSRKVEVRDAA